MIALNRVLITGCGELPPGLRDFTNLSWLTLKVDNLVVVRL